MMPRAVPKLNGAVWVAAAAKMMPPLSTVSALAAPPVMAPLAARVVPVPSPATGVAGGGVDDRRRRVPGKGGHLQRGLLEAVGVIIEELVVVVIPVIGVTIPLVGVSPPVTRKFSLVPHRLFASSYCPTCRRFCWLTRPPSIGPGSWRRLYRVLVEADIRVAGIGQVALAGGCAVVVVRQA